MRQEFELDWSGLGESIPVPDHRFGMMDVLVEYDGPQLAIHIVNWCPRYIGTNADYSADYNRWILAKLKPSDVVELANGAAVRALFDRAELIVVDFDHHGEMQRAWKIDIADAPDGPLAVPGAPLPDWCRKHLRRCINDSRWFAENAEPR